MSLLSATSDHTPQPTAPRRGRYYACIGTIGVGKTTMGQIMAEELGAEFVPERFAENAFLTRFYEQDADGSPVGIVRWGLHTELSFLAQRHEMGKEIAQLLDSGRDVVTDFCHLQNLVFSKLTLNAEEYALYADLFHRMMRDIPAPDQVVWVTADLEATQARIAGRGRAMESHMPDEYLLALTSGYEELAGQLQCPVTRIDTTNLPIPTDEHAQASALHEVWGSLGYCPVPHPAQQHIAARTRRIPPAAARRTARRVG